MRAARCCSASTSEPAHRRPACVEVPEAEVVRSSEGAAYSWEAERSDSWHSSAKQRTTIVLPNPSIPTKQVALCQAGQSSFTD